MNVQEHKLRYPLGDSLPESGHSLEVAPGVKWVRMPLPFALDHINLWLLRDRFDGREGWTIVDAGICRDEVKATWEAVFESELEGLPVLRLIVTHMHPDHIGLAHWLCERWKVPLWMSMTDYMTAKLWAVHNSTSGAGGQGAMQHFANHGMTDPESLAKVHARANYYVNLVPQVPECFYRLMHGDCVQIGSPPCSWEVITGYGHAPEHLSLYCADKGVLIAGDMVLPRISTNVSVFSYEPLANPLPLYLNSLNAYKPLPANTLVLPSHGKPFVGLHERIAQQHAHHKDRLQEVLDACDYPKTTMEIVPILFKRSLDLHQMTFAMGEAIAHLHALYFDNKIRRMVDQEGIIRFQKL
jgi:glyoxylase-like metal-dependent hydrolase (beta-lactamase superfamily II)